MKIEGERQRISVTKSDVSGSLFDDVNMSGWSVHNVNPSGLRIDKANLAGCTIANTRLAGMTIDGIEVTELLAAWKERQAGDEKKTA